MARSKRVRFRSPKLGLIINAEPNGPRVEFVNGEYSTDDPKVVSFLRKHRGYGLWIFEDAAPVSGGAVEGAGDGDGEGAGES